MVTKKQGGARRPLQRKAMAILSSESELSDMEPCPRSQGSLGAVESKDKDREIRDTNSHHESSSSSSSQSPSASTRGRKPTRLRRRRMRRKAKPLDPLEDASRNESDSNESIGSVDIEGIRKGVFQDR